jgi:hypothetical protein
MNQVIYRCRLCGLTFETGLPDSDEMEGRMLMCDSARGERFRCSPYAAPLVGTHGCAHGGTGITDLLGVRWVDGETEKEGGKEG